MMTSENRQSVIDFLKTKKLPLDLLVEVEDHMAEQIEYVMDHEDLSFDDAFLNVQKKWEKDLKLRYSFLPAEYIPEIQRRVSKEFRNAVVKKSAIFFTPIFVISILLLLTSKTFSYYYLLGLFVILFISYLFLMIRFNKIYRKTSTYKNKGISYLQNGASSFNGLVFMLPAIVFINYDDKFEKFYSAFYHFLHLEFHINSVILFFMYYLLLFFGLISVFYFLEFRKAVHYLEKRINHKI